MGIFVQFFIAFWSACGSSLLNHFPSFHFFSPSISSKFTTPTWTLLRHLKFIWVVSIGRKQTSASTICKTRIHEFLLLFDKSRTQMLRQHENLSALFRNPLLYRLFTSRLRFIWITALLYQNGYYLEDLDRLPFDNGFSNFYWALDSKINWHCMFSSGCELTTHCLYCI